MVDITMCNDDSCKLKTLCYRNKQSGTEITQYRQSFFVESPRDNDQCDYFMSTKNKKVVI